MSTSDDLVGVVFPQFSGIVIEGVEAIEGAVRVHACAGGECGACPDCGVVSWRVHGHYGRRLADLPVGGRPVQVVVSVHRFACTNPQCPRRTFVGQVEGLTRRYRRRSVGLQHMLADVALFVGGRPGARLAGRLAVTVSRSTMLRLLRELPLPVAEEASVLGIDDFALRRGQVYGTIVIDMATHHPVEVLPDRTSTTVAQWLSGHPGVEVVCRDRAGAYAEAVRTGAPDAIQVADRWHLWHNLSDTVGKLVTRERTQLAAAMPEPDQDGGDLPASQSPDDRSSASSASSAGTVTRGEPVTAQEVTATVPAGQLTRLAARTIERHAAVHTRLDAGRSISAISRDLRLDPHTVRRFARAATAADLLGERCRRDSVLDAFKDYLQQRWNLGVTDATQLTAEITARGYTGSDQTVRRYLHPLRVAGLPAPPPVATPPTMRQVTGWLTRRPGDLSETDTATLNTIIARCPAVASTYDLVRDFATILTQLHGEQLPTWLARVDHDGEPELRAFAASLRRDLSAVTNGLTLPYSSGAVEGNVNRIKTIKRQMYGRAGFDLLRRRVLLAA
jgi:transposase